MKNSMKYTLIVALVLIGAVLLVSGNAGAVLLAPQQPVSTTVVGAMPVASPVFGSVSSSAVGVRPFGFGFGFPFFRPFFGFPFFNPFFDADPFFFD